MAGDITVRNNHLNDEQRRLHERLMTLLSMAMAPEGWKHRPDPVDAGKGLWELAAHYAGAVRADSGDLDATGDARLLPDVVLGCLSAITDEMLEPIADEVAELVSPWDPNPRVIGQLWRDDVLKTAWDLHLALTRGRYHD